MADNIKVNVADLNAAIRLYYEKFELSTNDIKLIFGVKSGQTARNYKKIAQEKMLELGRKPYSDNSVPTDVAFEAWGLDIGDLERRRSKLIKLGVMAGTSVPSEVAADV